jgi:hybrid cluster-associated redox disulfide protein
MSKKITKDMLVGEVLEMDTAVAPLFIEMGMHCLGCPGAQMESLEMACKVHGADPDDLVNKLNAHFEGK